MNSFRAAFHRCGASERGALPFTENRAFPDTDMFLIEEGSWSEFEKKPEVQQKRAADEISYCVDRLIERIGLRRRVSEHALRDDAQRGRERPPSHGARGSLQPSGPRRGAGQLLQGVDRREGPRAPRRSPPPPGGVQRPGAYFNSAQQHRDQQMALTITSDRPTGRPT